MYIADLTVALTPDVPTSYQPLTTPAVVQSDPEMLSSTDFLFQFPRASATAHQHPNYTRLSDSEENPPRAS